MTHTLGQAVVPPVAPVAPANDICAPKQYAGIRRAPYFVLMAGTGIPLVLESLGIRQSPAAIYLLLAAVQLGLVVGRLWNIGWSGWWALLCLVPIVGLLVGVPCAVCQEGYRHTRKLDDAGRLLVCVFTGVIGTITGLVILAACI